MRHSVKTHNIEKHVKCDKDTHTKVLEIQFQNNTLTKPLQMNRTTTEQEHVSNKGLRLSTRASACSKYVYREGENLEI